MSGLVVKRDPLVLLHGLNNTPAVWDGLAEHWDGAYSLLTPMLPALADLDAIARALLDDLPARFWLAGHSFGGYVALAILALAPERVAGLALISSTPQADSAAQAQGRCDAILAAAGDALAGSWTQAYAERMQIQGATAFHPRHRDDPVLQARRRAMLQDYGPYGFVAHALAALGRPDRRALLRTPLRTPLPLLWVAGSDDPLYPPQAVQAMQADAGHGAVQVIGPAGHLLPLEQPRALATTLRAWLPH